MHPEWRAFLDDRGATVDDHDRVHFGDAEPAPDCALCDLSDLGLIRVTGDDAISFLQGQLTNDVARISTAASHLSALCNPKGRMLALFRVFAHDGDLYLQAPRERIGPMLQRLRMYVLRAQAELSDAGDTLARVGIAGDCAAALLPCTPPAEDNAVIQCDGLTVIRLPGDRPRFEVVGDCGSIIALWQQASATARPATPDFWPLLDIRAGLPNVYDLTAEAFVPQMANLQLVDGVSFSKGCYTGQEVVARMQYLGKLKRRMYGFALASEPSPAPGDNIYAGGNDQSVGKIVDARLDPAGTAAGLAVIQIDSAEAGNLRVHDPDGPTLELAPPPYPFTPPDDSS